MKKLIGALTLIGAVCLLSAQAWALPQFSRKYSFDCSTCHWPTYPQLNKFGYEFRAAGYRPAADIGKDDSDKFDWENTSSIKVGNTVTGTYVNDTAAVTTGTHFEFTGPDLDIMPFTASFAKNWATSFDIMPMITMGTVQFGRAYLRYTGGSEHDFFTARLGLFAPFEGYGAADASVLIDDNLLNTTNNATVPFSMGDNQYGLELGYTHDDTRLTLGVFNGLSATGMTFSETSGGSDHNQKDFLAYLNQFIGDDGLAFSGYFYNGYFTGTPFLRAALYATVPIGKSVEVLGGGELGTVNAGAVTCSGAFGTLELSLDDNTSVTGRYDYFNSNTGGSNMDLWAGTLGMNLLLNKQVKLEPQYRVLATNQAGGYLYNHSLQLLAQVLY